jgi:CDP-glycerol glycerophosphotransferase (TagB/SpsB family)
VFKPILVSGLVKFDPIFRGELTRDTVLNLMGIAPSKKIILFAPTYNRELSAVPVVTDSVYDWVDADTHLIIKLHGMSPPEWFDLYRLIAEDDPRITLADELDLTPYLVAADVMVSDVSSAFMEFMALDKPVVLVNNPLRARFIGFDPRDIEYAWRDVGVEVDYVEEIHAAIKRCLENPAEKSGKRMLYGPRLIGPVDGRAAERIGEAVLSLMGRK